jgi:hypothetical protein
MMNYKLVEDVLGYIYIIANVASKMLAYRDDFNDRLQQKLT